MDKYAAIEIVYDLAKSYTSSPLRGGMTIEEEAALDTVRELLFTEELEVD